MSSRRMTAHIDAIRVAAVLRDMSDGPRKRRGRIFDLCRVRIFRREPVARDHGQEARLGKSISQRKVKRAVARTPSTPMKEQKYRHWALSLRHEEVEFVFRGVLGFAFLIDEVAFDLDARGRF